MKLRENFEKAEKITPADFRVGDVFCFQFGYRQLINFKGDVLVVDPLHGEVTGSWTEDTRKLVYKEAVLVDATLLLDPEVRAPSLRCGVCR